MTKKKTQKKQEVYYIGVREPVELRRSLLESSRELIHFLQMYEKYKAARNEKRESIALLKAQMRELYGLINDLKKVLPQTDLRISERHHRQAPKAESKPQSTAPPITQIAPPLPDKELSEIEKLEAELAHIEGKLNTLS